jgi:hypothetical protein
MRLIRPRPRCVLVLGKHYGGAEGGTAARDHAQCGGCDWFMGYGFARISCFAGACGRGLLRAGSGAMRGLRLVLNQEIRKAGMCGWCDFGGAVR